MIIGILPKASTAETLLNNLSEADFDPKTVSVVMGNLKQRNAIAKDAGPFKGVTAATLAAKLAQAGLSPQDAKPYLDAVSQGMVFVALAAPQPSEAAGKEMFADASAQLIRTL